MAHKLKNRLLVLIHERELKEGRRIKQVEIAKAIGVANHTIGSWIRNDVTKFEAHVIEGLCAYFECQVGDLLYLETVDEGSDDKGEVMIEELEHIALTTDLPEHGLSVGDIGMIVHIYSGGRVGKGYEVEFVTLGGELISLVSVYPEQIRLLGHDEIANARL